MNYDTLKRDLIVHKIYSAWQFVEYTEKNIAIVKYCAETIKSIVSNMTMQTVSWQQDLASDFIDTVTENGKKVKQLSVTTENAPVYKVTVAENNVDPWFLFDKMLRDFFQYAMNAFDSISQVINSGLLANNGKKVDSVDIQVITKTFNQLTYSTAFPKMQAWLNTVSSSPEFQYIEAINNRTKHTADISNKLSMGILGCGNTTEIGSFFRKEVQHSKKELSDQLQATVDFLVNSWDEFLIAFSEEYIKDTYIQNRIHSISGVYQQKLKNEPDQNFSYAYISTSDEFDSMPDELLILLINKRENQIYSHECTFDTILIKSASNDDILGRYCADSVIGDDCLLHYRKYIKDKDTTGAGCIAYAFEEDTKFYHLNPFFDVKSVSDDEGFLARISLPF